MMPTEHFYVYIHSRLRSGEPFYVGKGCGNRHSRAHSRTPHWKNIVAKDGGFHTSFVARGVDEDLAFMIEVETIDKYRRVGVRLANASNGGEGPSGMKHSEETKAKMSVSHKGMASAWMRGRSPSPETRAKLSMAGMGRSPSQETRAKLSAANKGRKPSALAVARSIEIIKSRPSPRKGRPGKKHSDETKEKFRKAWERRRLVPESAETRTKKSVVAKFRHANGWKKKCSPS